MPVLPRKYESPPSAKPVVILSNHRMSALRYNFIPFPAEKGPDGRSKGFFGTLLNAIFPIRICFFVREAYVDTLIGVTSCMTNHGEPRS